MLVLFAVSVYINIIIPAPKIFLILFGHCLRSFPLNNFLYLFLKTALKKFLIFSQKEAFLIFQEMEPFKLSSIKVFLIFQEKESVLKISYVSGENFQSSKIKNVWQPTLTKSLILREWEKSYISVGNLQNLIKKFLIFL